MLLVRVAKIEDMALYFRWVNDPVTRNNAFETKLISWETHRQWFSEKLQDRNTCFYVFEEDEIAIGQVRFYVRGGNKAEIGYSVDERFRGQGYGGKLLISAISELVNNYKEIKILIAKVKRQNIASNKIFVKLGFNVQSKVKDVIEYSLFLEGDK